MDHIVTCVLLTLKPSRMSASLGTCSSPPSTPASSRDRFFPGPRRLRGTAPSAPPSPPSFGVLGLFGARFVASPSDAFFDTRGRRGVAAAAAAATGSSPAFRMFRCNVLFQRFLMEFSVRPGMILAISAHLLPCSVCICYRPSVVW